MTAHAASVVRTMRPVAAAAVARRRVNANQSRSGQRKIFSTTAAARTQAAGHSRSRSRHVAASARSRSGLTVSSVTPISTGSDRRAMP